jgi:DNA-binding Xre family transcriptional regulator
MGISYEPLFHLLLKKKLKKTDLYALAGLNTNTVAKFSKGEQVGLDVIERLCKALDCQPSDIFEITKD